MRMLATMGLLALTLAGCAHTRAINQGDTHARDGLWRSALDDYRSAQGLRPGSRRIARRIERALEQIEVERQQTVRDALSDAEQALFAGDHEAMAASLERALAADPGNVLARELGWEAAVELLELSRDLADRGQHASAYPLAVLALRLAPGDPTLVAHLGSVRAELMRQAVALAELGRFEEASELAGRIHAHDPVAASELLLEVHRRWATALRGEAGRDEAAGRPATAMMKYARAAALAGEVSDARSRDRLAAGLAEDARFTVAWSSSTDPQVEALREGVIQAFAGDGKTAFGSGADLVVERVIVAWQCDQHVTPRTGEHRFRSGSVWVDNPAWAEALATVRSREADELFLDGELVRTADLLRAVDRELTLLIEVDLPPLRQAFTTATDTLTAHKTAEREAQARLEEAMTALRAAEHPAQGAPDAVAVTRLRAKVERATTALAGARDALDETTRAHERAQRDLARAERDLRDLRDEADRVEQARAEASDALQRARLAVHHARVALEATPGQVEEALYDTFRYAVSEVERACSTDVTVVARNGAGKRALSFTATAWVRDEAHDAHPDFGIAADPVRFARGDDALVSDALVQVEAQIARFLVATRDRHYVALWERAASAGDDETVTALYVAGLRLDADAAPRAVTDYLARRWRVSREDLGG